MLYDMLKVYADSGVTPMHMPGHKRNRALLGSDLPYTVDITEIDGFDNLQDPRGVLRELSELAAQVYSSAKAYPLVNGATGGILAAVTSVCRPGDLVLLARNCHKAVYHAVQLLGLRPVYLQPAVDVAFGITASVTPQQVEAALAAHPEAALVIVTSPTYEGVVSDISAISAAAHRAQVPLLVDGAHGAHLGFSPGFPQSPVTAGADFVIVSLHKTLPALTQCALALVNTNAQAAARFQAALGIFLTSSPSYVLLASIDRCVRLLQDSSVDLFRAYSDRLAVFDEKIAGLKRLRVLCHGSDSLGNHPHVFGYDPGKIVIGTGGVTLSGPELMARLRGEFHIELEMAARTYAVAMTSICDTSRSIQKLADALVECDRQLDTLPESKDQVGAPELPCQAMSPGEAVWQTGEALPLAQAVGRVSLEYVWAYPPGIPFLVPGEVVAPEFPEALRQSICAGIDIKSTNGTLPHRILCAPVNIDKQAKLW